MLTADQKKKMEENRKRALEKRAERQSAIAISNATSTAVIQDKVASSVTMSTGHFNSLNIEHKPGNVNAVKINQTPLTSISNNAVPSNANFKKTAKLGASGKSANPATLSVCLDGRCVLISRNRFRIDIGYHKEMIEAFKKIPSRMYDAQGKKWNFAIKDHDLLVKALKPLSPSCTVSPLTRTVVQVFSKAGENKIVEVDLSSLDEKLQEALLPFQREGVYYSLARQGRVLIADDMGLGKTIQAIAVANYYIAEWPLLVVAPSSVRYTWAEAFYTWMPSLPRSDVNIINKTKDDIFEGNVVITSYDILNRKSLDFKKRGFQVVILDESHFLKNHKSARTKAAQDVTKKSKRVVLLSGTPALSRPIELFTQISMIKPTLFKGYQDFGMRYCNGRLMPWGWDYTGSSNMQELQLVLEETIMIRRLKSEVITQLPAKRRQVILLDPSNIRGNKKQLNHFTLEMNNVKLKNMEKRGVLLKFFQETGAAKLSAIQEYITDLLEAGHKFLCFAHHQIVINEICQLLENKDVKHIRIDGSTPSDTRKVLCDKFQFNDDCRVAVLSITAASTGISLTAAHLVLFAELFWNPGILTQAEDRAHRIGQQDSVIVQYLVAQGTADDFIWPLVQKKLDILSKAGLSKDNFRDADTCTVKMADSAQTTLDSFLEDESFDEFWNEFDAETHDFNDEGPAEKRGKIKN